MRRIILSRPITATSYAMINASRKKGRMVVVHFVVSLVEINRQSNILKTPSKTHVDGCGYTFRQDLETNEPITTGTRTEAVENDANEIIEESDILLEGFETDIN